MIVATGHTPSAASADDDLPGSARPATLRVVNDVDVFVTNGGFGGVQLALAHGVPLVVGRTEDKVEVSARVDWASVGISLRTARPTPTQLAAGVRRVPTDPNYRKRAEEMARIYTRYRGTDRAVEVITDVAALRACDPRPRGIDSVRLSRSR